MSDEYNDKKNAALHRKTWSTSSISTSKRQSTKRHALKTRLEQDEEVYLRLFLSTRALIMLVSRSKVTSRMPKRCQFRSKRTRWKHRVLLAGLMWRKRESQFICISGGPLRGAVSPPCSGPRSKPDRMEEELKLTARGMLVDGL
jgi:hypothetical protein